MMSEKEKQWEGGFLVTSSNILITVRNVLHYLILFYQSKLGFYTCFFNYQSCKCDQLSHNHIKCDLGYSYTYSSMQDYGGTLQEPSSSHIDTYSNSYLQKVGIGRYLNLLFDSMVETVYARVIFLKLSGAIWTNMSLRSGSNTSSLI